MPIDPSIALQVKPIQLANPLDQYAQIAQIQNAQNQSRLSDLAYQSGQRDLADQQIQRQALQNNPDGGEGYLSALAKGGNAKAYASVQKANLENSKTQAETTHLGAQTNQANATAVSQAFATHRDQINNVNDPPSAADWVRSAFADPLIGPVVSRVGTLDQALSKIPTDPQAFQQWKMQAGLSAQEYVKHTSVDANTAANNATSIKTTGMNNATSMANTASNNATSLANNKSNIQKDYAVNGLNPDGKDANGGIGGLTPAAIESGALRYNLDGTLPPSIGRGTQGARDIRAIQNRAAELSVGTNGTDLRINQLDNKASAAALTQLSRSQAMNGSFEKTANANADLALGLSKQMDRTGIPLLNAGIQALKTGTGSPEATQFAAANSTFVSEYAKIMSGGTGTGPTSDASRKKAETLITTSMTPEQYAGNVKLLQTEMSNRMKGFDDQISQVRNRMGGNKDSASTGQPTSAQPIAHPPEVTNLLNKYLGK